MEQRRTGGKPLVKITIYIEGGGAHSEKQDREFRAAWRAFFEKADLKRMPATFRGSGRDQAFKAYCHAVTTRRSDELPLLLVDSEDLVKTGHDAWKHLKARDNWPKPKGAGNEDAFLMITCMETWFVADRATLKAFFPKLIEKHIKQWPDLEKVPKPAVLAALKKATAKCATCYDEKAKGNAGFKLLGRLRATEVEKSCPAAKRLLDKLRNP